MPKTNIVSTIDESKFGTSIVNYVSNPGAESTPNSLTPFNVVISSNAPTGAPTLGSAVAAITVDSTTPLRGVSSYRLSLSSTFGAAIGHGWISDEITLVPSDLGKVLELSLEYKTVSGASYLDLSGTSSQSLEVWIYDVAAAAWVQPAGFRGINASGVASSVKTTFQSSVVAGQKYRVALLAIRSPSSAPVELNVDSIKLGPPVIAQGTPVTDWQTASVGNIVGVSGGSLSVGTGGGATYSAKYRRVGDSAEVSYTLRIGTSGTSDVTGVGNVYLFPYPTGMSPSGLFSYEAIGFGEITVVGSAAPTNRLIAKAYTNGFILDSTDSVLLASGGNLYNNANTLSVVITYKVAGWSSSVQMSNDTDTRVVAASAYYNAGSIVCASASDTLVNNYAATSLDTHGQFTISTGSYVVPVSGVYRIETLTALNGGAGVVSAAFVTSLFINNVYSTDVARYDTTPAVYNSASIVYSGSILVSLSAGQTVTLKIFQNSGQNKTLSALNFAISRLSGPSAIAATETVAVKAYKSSGAQTTSGSWQTVTSWGGTQFDTHGGFNLTTGLYTVPVSGKYLVATNVSFANNTTGVRQVRIVKNSDTSGFYGGSNGAPATIDQAYSCSSVMSCVAGDTIRVDAYQTSGGNLNYSVFSDIGTQISIVRVGN